MRKVIFIQARVGSSRLPFKVLQYVGDKTIVGHVIEAAKASGVGDVYVLTPNEPGDMLTVSEATRHQAAFYMHAGSAGNVLARFVMAANGIGLSDDDIIIRVCGDSPLIKPERIRTIAAALDNGGDVATFTIDGVPATIVGCGSVAEAIRVGPMRRLLWSGPTPEDCEHVTIGMYSRDSFDVRKIAIERPSEKESVDTLEDLKRIRRRFENGITTGDENQNRVQTPSEVIPDRQPDNRRQPSGVRRGRGRTKS